MLALLLISLLTSAFSSQQTRSEATTTIVPDDYTKIQWVIGNATDGDTIFIRAGTYYEHVIINKSISLIGENKYNTIIEGNGTFSAVVHVTADNVNISDFTIQNRNKGDVGIWLEHCRNCTVSGNIIKDIGASNGVRGVGIALDYCEGCTVERNNINNNNKGVVLAFSYGCIVHRNNVDNNNKFTGIDIHSCSECIVTRNILSNNENRGVGMYDSSHCTLGDNNISGSSKNFGVYGSGLPHFVHDIDVSNTINGKPIVYLLNEDDLTISSTTHPEIGYLAVVNSTNITVENLTLKHNGEGVLFAHTNDSIIKKISTFHNGYGIYLVNCDNSAVNENTATNNIYGIRLWNSSNCMVTENTATNNNVGIILNFCRNSTVSGNKERTVLFWMEWWFWSITVPGIVMLAVAFYFFVRAWRRKNSICSVRGTNKPHP